MVLPNFSVEGKVAIITGSSRGIGRGLALGFGEAGASVVAVARTSADLEAVAAQIKAQGGKALPVCADVTDSTQVSEMVKRAIDEFGRVDILVNTAGGGRFMPLLDIDEDTWDKMVDKNLKSCYLCCRAVGKLMIQQKSGSIINFGSAAGIINHPGEADYAAAKAGVHHFSRVLATEWGPFNVRVNCITPGAIDTSLLRAAFDANQLEAIGKNLPLRRIGKPDDVLGLAIFLASEASSWLTGVIIPISGGSL